MKSVTRFALLILLIIVAGRIAYISLDTAMYPSLEEQDVIVATATTSTSVPGSVSKPVLKTRPKAVPTFATLSIPAVNIKGGIEKVSVNSKGNMSSPSTYQTIGWYTGSSPLGEPGMAILDGHVNNGLGLSGVFANLDKVVVGNDIYVEKPDGTKLHYQVTKIYFADHTDKLDTLTKNVDSTSQIALVTCAGDWIPSHKTYEKRMVVLARII